MKQKTDDTKKPHLVNIAENRKARQRYQIEDKFEAGIVLFGTEVKALRQGKCQLGDAHAHLRNGEMYLLNMHISAYSHGGYANHEPDRSRKLLLHKHEIKKLQTKLERRGYTLIPLNVYIKNGTVKIELALCLGKTAIDRRDDIKERDAKREIDRAMKKKLKT